MYEVYVYRLGNAEQVYTHLTASQAFGLKRQLESDDLFRTACVVPSQPVV